MDAYHGNLNDVCLRTLYRSVDGIAFGKTTYGTVLRVDIWQIATALEDSLGIAFFACRLFSFFHVFVHLWEGNEIVFDELFSLSIVYFHTLCQAIGCYTIDDTKVGLLSLLTLCACNVGNILVVYLCCCGSMDVVTLAEGSYHILVA